jgi:Histidinol-phosphate/aromatic aminotransferase and cobyric acid decarboxylase
MELIDRILRPHLKDFQAYSSARNEYTGKKGVFLDANENPFGSAAGGNWNRYPDPNQQSLKRAITGIKAMDPANTFIGNGSDEAIDLLIRAFCEPGKDQVMIFPPTYGMYGVSARINHAGIQEVSLTDEFQIDVPKALEAIDEHTKLIFVGSPNNPTGNKMNVDDIEALIKHTRGLVVVDEAYIDFSPEQTFVRYVKNYDNLVVCRPQ